VVLTHTSAIGIAGWLPDGQRLLITRRIPGQPREYVETFNVQTGELQRYGERRSFDAKPIWLTAERAVAFADVSPDKQVVLRISRGESAPVEKAITGLAAPYLAASPDGRRVVFFTKAAQNRPEAFDVAQVQQQTFPFTLPLTPWQELPALGQQVGPEPYRAIWHPDGNQVAFYNDTGFYLADLATGQICEVDLGPHVDGKRWTFHAQWSPNGRYLAALTTVGDPPVGFVDLSILDMTTGELRSMHPEVYINPGQYYVSEIAWASNSQIVGILAAVEEKEGNLPMGLYLIQVATGQDRRMLPQLVFGGGDAGWNLAWSSDGRQMIVNCPTRNEGRLCLVAVTVQR